MKPIRLLAFLTCALTLRAQESPPPFPPALPQGKVEVDIDGKKEMLDLTDPATAVKLKGKMIVITEINGHREVRVVDAKDAEKLPAPFLWNEKPPLRTGPVTFLGVGAIEVPDDVAAQLTLPQDTGLQVALILPESPAAKAGLQESDVIQKFEDQILITPRQFAILIANRKEGDVVKLSILRKGAPMEISATLAKRNVPHTVESSDPVAKVKREIVKLGDKAEMDADFARALGQALKNAQQGRVEDPGKVMEWLQSNPPPTGKPAAAPASEDVGKAIREALKKLPPEERAKMEELLKESGALPKNTLPKEKED